MPEAWFECTLRPQNPLKCLSRGEFMPTTAQPAGREAGGGTRENPYRIGIQRLICVVLSQRRERAGCQDCDRPHISGVAMGLQSSAGRNSARTINGDSQKLAERR